MKKITDRETLVKYIQLCQQNKKDIEPYQRLIDDMTLFGTIDHCEEFIAELLGIPADIQELIGWYVFEGYVIDENNHFYENINEFADYIHRLLEERR